ncbi:ABC transporter ATP-binding protein [Halorubrum sp. 48-1-W]|uniref:ABC transporter ATP-binding protein n=1 Tax=Halorubrum sp. 48-1-W TaxID=2249761 RepID=UPI000DCEE9FA|nr:ABC transporter ATP-binding protein [Halorubrum sp. 48-1-W]RAW45258.1 ABC transporter ATP-binding protein [Halorubrum sp. 48-1-W]
MGSERDDASAPVAVELEGVSKRYDGAVAVEGVDLRIREGEFFTLVGPSGCGKTTTLRLIAGFEEPTAGTVRFDGRDVSGVPPEGRNVGVVFQNYALFPHMTVGENVGYGLRFSDPPGGVSPAERVRELLDLVDLPGTADRDPESLSGGQRQRVAMARALAPGPDLLLLDEPMSALDARLRERLRLQVRGIQRELGITTVYVTHDQEEALSVSDRVAVMRDGTPEQVAPPRTVYRRPASRFVAEFVGDNNVFEGVVAGGESGDGDGQGGRNGTTGGDGNRGGPGTVPVDVGGTTLHVAVGGRDDAVNGVPAPGDRITFCVRPQHLRVGRGDNGFRADVESAEFLGETTRVHLGWGDRELVVRTEDPLRGTVAVGFDPANAHVISVASTADTS